MFEFIIVENLGKHKHGGVYKVLRNNKSLSRKTQPKHSIRLQVVELKFQTSLPVFGISNRELESNEVELVCSEVDDA